VAAELFVDTSAWFPIADSHEQDHARLARALRERVQRGARVVTTDFVLAESHALIMRRVHREAAQAFLHTVRRPPNVIVPGSGHVDDAIRQWLGRFTDQDFSLTDGVSFAVMTDRGIREALTLDHHFVAAGFVAVP
jgi:predicted nucleic acid-binding protein